MRRARYFPMVVIGLAGFACQPTMQNQCCAWDGAPSAAMYDQSYAPQYAPQSGVAQMGEAPMSGPQSYMVQDGGQQPAGRMVDKSVQQAGYYDSRPRPNSTSIMQPNGDPNNANNSNSANNSTTSTHSAPMFHGQPLHMPNLLFGRQQSTPTNRPAANSQQSNASQPNSGQQPNAMQSNPNAVPRGQVRIAAQAPTDGRPMQQRIPAGPYGYANNNYANSNNYPASNNNYQAARVADGRPPQPIRQDVVVRPTARIGQPVVATPIPDSSPVKPWAPTPLVPPTTKPSAAITPKPGAPLSPADRLVAEAHELSSHAQSEQDFTRVIETCRRAEASQPSPATVQFAKNLIAWSLNRRGQLKAEAGEEKEAMLDFDDAIRTDATCWRAMHNRGVLLAQAGRFERAFDDFSHTIQINPEFAKAYSNRAALFMVADNLNKALQDYNRAVALDPNLAVAHRGCGRVCQLLGKTDEAVEHYDAAVQLAPTDAYAAACRADLLTDVGRYSEAVAEYNRAIEIDPKSSQAQGGSAWLLATCPDSSVRNPELAVERAKTVLETGGDKEAINYDTLAAAQASAGDFGGAMESVRKAIEIAPADEREAYANRLTMYQKAKPYRISPVERETKQVSYEAASGAVGVAR